MEEKALQRRTLAELMRGERRHPWEVVLDHMHTLDVIARDARLALADGEPITPQQLDRIVETAKVAHHLAKTAIDVGAHEKIAESFRRQVDLEGQVVADVVGRTLDLLVDRLTASAVPVRRRDELRDWVFAVAGQQLQALDGRQPADPAPPWPLAERAQLEPAQSSAADEQPPVGSRRPAPRDQPPAWRVAPTTGGPSDAADAAVRDDLAARRSRPFIPHE